ncbi:MAG: efflux pump, inner rane subunit [Acidobacteriales bacterium]|nr:efflux pump, inner rane subunit [Terriglobales bacterium]
MNKMIISNLVHRPIRSLISITAIAVEVTLILVIVGLSMGILNDAKTRTAGIGADVMVRPPGSSNFVGVSGAPVSIKVADVLRKLPHAAAVSPVVTQMNTGGGSVEVLYGIDLPSFESLSNGFHYISGGPFTGPDDIIVDDLVASSKHLKVGDEHEVLNHKFRVSGIIENGKGARKFMPIQTVQEMIGAQGKASIFYVRLDDPANAAAFADEVKHVPGMQTYSAQSVKEWLSLMTPDNVPGFSAFIDVVIGVSVCIGFIVIFQSMYTAVMERTREIGILKSMGASKWYVVKLILRETMALAIAGILVGIGISYLASYGIVHKFPTVRVVVQPDWVLKAALIAAVGSLMGAVYPAFRAAQKDPIDALAYE